MNDELERPVPKLAYSIKETARALEVSPSTIYRLILQGELTPIKVVGRTRIQTADLVAYLDRQRLKAK